MAELGGTWMRLRSGAQSEMGPSGAIIGAGQVSPWGLPTTSGLMVLMALPGEALPWSLPGAALQRDLPA